jgi:magnesium-transporting ATPase (P-type)
MAQVSVAAEPVTASSAVTTADPPEPLTQLFRDLSTSPAGLSAREVARRLEVPGPNELARRGGRHWPRELARQFTHPLALLLMLASVLAEVSGSPRLGIAIVAVMQLVAARFQGSKPRTNDDRLLARLGPPAIFLSGRLGEANLRPISFGYGRPSAGIPP